MTCVRGVQTQKIASAQLWHNNDTMQDFDLVTCLAIINHNTVCPFRDLYAQF